MLELEAAPPALLASGCLESVQDQSIIEPVFRRAFTISDGKIVIVGRMTTALLDRLTHPLAT
jgi:hypothetical protein